VNYFNYYHVFVEGGQKYPSLALVYPYIVYLLHELEKTIDSHLKIREVVNLARELQKSFVESRWANIVTGPAMIAALCIPSLKCLSFLNPAAQQSMIAPIRDLLIETVKRFNPEEVVLSDIEVLPLRCM